MNKFFSTGAIPFLACCLLTLSHPSCKSTKTNVVTSPATDTLKTFVLKYERGPCFGQCPVYAFYLLSDHTALVHAKANLMDTAGWYFAMPDQEGIVEILEILEPEEWWEQDMSDQPEIADLPHVSLLYFHPKGIRNLSIQNRTTHSLETAFGKLNHLVTESIWKPTLLRPKEVPDSSKTNVIVQLQPGVDIQQWMKKYDQFGIRLVKRISPKQAYYVVAKDPDKGYANDFLQYIKLDPDVIDAQWDRELERR